MSAFLESLGIPNQINIESYVAKAPEGEKNRSAVILGSFKYHDEINRTIEILQQGGIHVLAPKKSTIVSNENGFPILKSDLLLRKDLEKQYGPLTSGQFDALVEKIFTETIRQAGFVYIVASGGYAGKTVAGEVGIAIGSGLPIYASEQLNGKLDENAGDSSPLWEGTAKQIKVYTPENLITMTRKNKLDAEDYPWCSGYIAKWPQH